MIVVEKLNKSFNGTNVLTDISNQFEKGKTNLMAEKFAQESSTERLSPERKQFSKLSSIDSPKNSTKKAKSTLPQN